MEIEMKARELAELLINSEIYQSYIAAKEEIEKDPELMQRVEEYRKVNFLVQNEDKAEKYEDLKRMAGNFSELLSHKRVKKYLERELILCRTIQNINTILVEKLDFDINFLG